MTRRSFVLFSIASTCSYAFAKDMKIVSWHLGKYGDFTFTKMHENVYVMHGVNRAKDKDNMGFTHNITLIEAKNSLIVIDPGLYQIGLHVLNQIKNISSKPITAIINTHDHDDHWFANSVLKDAYPNLKIYAHKLMKSAAEELYGGDYKHRGFSFDNAKKISFADIHVDDGDKFSIDAEDFYIQHPKNAHTNNDIAITHLNSNTIIMGDLLMESNLAHFGLNASIYGNIEFLNKINKQNEYALYIPGHGLSGSKEPCFKPYYTFMNILLDETKKALIDDVEYVKMDLIRQKVDTRLQWEENLNFNHNFLDGYISALYSEIEDRESF